MIFQPELETLPRPELERLQTERLRERFGIEPESLAQQPFATKSQLRDAYPFGLLRVPLRECVRVHGSSGTRGKATIVAYTRGDIDLWADCCARAVAAAGGGPGTVVQVAYGYGLFTGGLGLHYGAERLGCTVIPASGGNTPRQAQLLEDLGAEILCCTPSYALAIADHVSEPARLNLRAGLFGAEPWTEGLAHAIAHALGAAQKRIRIASPVITSGPILGTLAEIAADRNVDLAGVVDATQISEVRDQWEANGNASWKLPSLAFVLQHASFTGKHSTPYAPGAVHDYMHAKVTVCDDTVFVGSFNLSHSGEQNAENVLQIEDAALADRMAAYIDEIRARYEPVQL